MCTGESLGRRWVAKLLNIEAFKFWLCAEAKRQCNGVCIYSHKQPNLMALATIHKETRAANMLYKHENKLSQLDNTISGAFNKEPSTYAHRHGTSLDCSACWNTEKKRRK